MNHEEARAAVLERAQRRCAGIPEEIVINDAHTIEKPYGWIFYYNTRRYYETGDIMYKILGRGPVIVIAATGEIIEKGSAYPSEVIIRMFEEERHLL